MVFLRRHPDLPQAIEDAGQPYQRTLPARAADKGKDQVIAALRRRLEEMKQLATKDQELRGKQREIDLRYGKLPAASPPLTDAELRRTLVDALQRLAVQGLGQKTSAG